jgi:hypothetical protein
MGTILAYFKTFVFFLMENPSLIDNKYGKSDSIPRDVAIVEGVKI